MTDQYIKCGNYRVPQDVYNETERMIFSKENDNLTCKELREKIEKKFGISMEDFKIGWITNDNI